MTSSQALAGCIVLGVAIAIAGTAYVITRPKVADYCDVQTCLDRETATREVAVELAELILCCDIATGDCSVAQLMTDCHPELEYVAICDWGRSLATGGIECYD